MSLNSRECRLLLSYDAPPNWQMAKEADYMQKMESKNEETKVAALKCLISSTVSGESYPRLLMSVIKYCLHSDHHLLKKLLLTYWEVVEKRTKDGNLMHEMILVCNAMKNNLTHANEYIRGATLRFLCKISDVEILESLIPSITSNLEHRHSYVRKNAVLAVFHIYQTHPDLIPDAPELIENFLYNESNPAAKRNAFMMLFHCDLDRAVNFLATVLNTVNTMGEPFQLVVLELMRKVCKTNPSMKGEYLRCIFTLVGSQSASVSFAAANTLVALSSAPTAVRAAVAAYCSLLGKESDVTIKLVILSRLSSLRRRHLKLMQDLLMDILSRALQASAIDIKKRTIELALQLLTNRNVEEMVATLKKELAKTEQAATNPQESNLSAGSGAGTGGMSGAASSVRAISDAYRKVLMDALHSCAVQFPQVVPSVVHLLITYLGDENPSAAGDVAAFVREIVHAYPSMRSELLSRVRESFADIQNADVYRTVIWILGEYATDALDIEAALQVLQENIGKLPLLGNSGEKKDEGEVKQEEKKEEKHVHDVNKAKKGPVILADGTYASSSAQLPPSTSHAVGSTSSSTSFPSSQSHLRTLLLNGDYLLGSVVSNAYAKLVLRFAQRVGLSTPESNEIIAKALMVCVSILKMGASPLANKYIDPDNMQRISLIIQVLLDPSTGLATLGGDATGTIAGVNSAAVFEDMLEDQRKKQPGKRTFVQSKKGRKDEEEEKKVKLVKQADDLILIRQLKGGGVDDGDADEDDESVELQRALAPKPPSSAAAAATTTGAASSSGLVGLGSQLNRVYQLTGFSDPLYVESHLIVQDYDVLLDLLVVNQTTSTLHNLTIELYTSGDLKVIDRPAPFSLAPAGPNHTGTHRLRVTIKLSSTESGVIFGSASYDNASGSTKSLVVLNNIHLDVMDYIAPATCSDVAFRAMWAEFEWENKVAVNTDLTDLTAYLHHILSITNMKCMTPMQQLIGSDTANFLAANLYARSMFGEDALLNLSVEKQKSGKVAGYIRIRSKTQGIALSLGDKIQAKQRGNKA